MENQENKEDKGFDVVKLAACIFVGFVAMNVVAGVGQGIACAIEDHRRKKELVKSMNLELKRMEEERKKRDQTIKDINEIIAMKKAQHDAEQTSNNDNNDNNTSKK